MTTHFQRDLLPFGTGALVAQALEEDRASADVTTDACVPEGAKLRAKFVGREDFVLCGTQVAEEVYRQLGGGVDLTWNSVDGQIVPAGTTIGEVVGSARHILYGERIALNFLQRLSGIATTTQKYVSATQLGSAVRITETRKTTPCHRHLERYAVRCGGGFNHRPDLSAAVMIKDNHIAIAGGVTQAVQAARSTVSHMCVISCEVESESQVREALEVDVDVIVLDNFDLARMEKCVSLIARRAKVEITGGVTLDNIAAIARLDVDVISIGSLTQRSQAIDIGLDVE